MMNVLFKETVTDGVTRRDGMNLTGSQLISSKDLE